MPQTVLAQEHGTQIMIMPRTVSIPLPNPSFLLSQDARKVSANFSRLLAGTYQRESSLEHFSPMDQVKTPTLTQSSLPLFQLWSGRFQLGAFQSTLHVQNIQLGALGSGGPTRQSYPGGSPSVHFSGLSLSFHFGRDSRTSHPTQAWQRMTRFVGTVLN
jgi:hypothetical protein